MQQSRRNFLLTSSGAALGSFIVTGLEAAEAQAPVSDSGLATGLPVPLRYASIPDFLSERQLAVHHQSHYGGALRGYLNLDKELQSTNTFSSDAIKSKSKGRTSKANSVVLHEVYFAHLTSAVTRPDGDLAAAIRQRFGSYDKWAADFIATGKSAAGWALLVYHPVSKKLYNVISDEHSMNVLWMASPLIALDTYEHAFYIDYENRKADYIEKFMQHIDWTVVQRLPSDTG